MAIPADKLTDGQLWRRFKGGDQEALKVIYFRHYSILFNYGKKLTSSPELAEDCVQDLFLKLWRTQKNLGQVVSIRAYLFKAYRRILLDLVKVQRRYTKFTDLPLEYDLMLSVEQLTMQDENQREQLNGLNSAIKSLSKRQKEIVYLCFYRGFTYKEIEQIISIKNQTIRNCVYEAVKTLRKSMNKVKY
ncbi:MAG: sigma-70 family RNA polymerase sigma factor [Cyclobacteriaceae bacterium]|nr:sigma-70 family RNA polymerase sigma factor [Cyclobacteriaceae bacterium]